MLARRLRLKGLEVRLDIGVLLIGLNSLQNYSNAFDRQFKGGEYLI